MGLGIRDWGLGIENRFDVAFFVLLAGLVVEDYHIPSPTFGVTNQIFYY